MRLAVTGSRHWSDEELLRDVLDRIALRRRSPYVTVIQGGADGADWMARTWAIDRGHKIRDVLPDYDTHGKPAPLIRNTQIVAEADGVVAFRAAGYSGGTDDTIAKALSAGNLWLLISAPCVRDDRRKSAREE